MHDNIIIICHYIPNFPVLRLEDHYFIYPLSMFQIFAFRDPVKTPTRQNTKLTASIYRQYLHRTFDSP
jgi:hypothetical protein